MTYYLAVDIGASSGRHILGSIQDGKLVLEEIYRFPNNVVNDNGSLVWDIENLVKEVKAGIKECSSIGKIPKTVAIDTWAVDYVLLDKEKSPIMPVIAYRNNRTESVQDEAEKIMPFSELYKRTGIQKQPFNTVYQLYCDKLSGKLDNAEHFLMIPEYLAFTLTGEIKNEYTNASTTAMVNAETGDWDDEILSAFGIKKSIFSPLSMPATSIGEFTKEMQDFAGFNAEVVFCPTHDTASAVAACPIDDNSVYISSGTWSLLGTESKTPVISDESRKANFTNEGGVERRFRVLKNIMGMWLFQNIRRNVDKKYTYDEMMEMAQKCGDYRIFDVNDASLVAPENMIDAIAELIGEDRESLPLIINSTYHSLAKAYNDSIEQIEKISGKTIENIFIVGGGSKDKYLNSLTSQVTGKRVITGLGEATATGNIISQIMFDRGIDLTEARKIVKSSFDIKEAEI